MIGVQIRKLSFAIVRSTTIALPAWREVCAVNGLPPRLIPRNVTTRWNSTYDMLSVAVEYRTAIDDITADKSVKLRKYELDEEDWEIVRDLLHVLKVHLRLAILLHELIGCRFTKKLHYCSQQIQSLRLHL